MVDARSCFTLWSSSGSIGITMTNLDFLKETQDTLEFSNERMARLLGVRPKTYLAYLHGTRNVTTTMRNFCMVLNSLGLRQLKIIENSIEFLEGE